VIEIFAPGFLYSLLKDGISLVRGSRRRLKPSEIVAQRQKRKPLFEAEVWKNYREKLREDVIVRDMKRIDSYPDIAEAKGISPWFRGGLVNTYHRGILVALGWGTLTKHRDGEHWRFTDYASEEKGDIRVLLIGSIPYENIENVDWNGDEYYGYPHIYCFFTYKKEPYEHVGFYTETKPRDAPPFYTEVAPYDEVRRLSRRLGIQHFS
jgi:hypothetical protein